MGTEKERDTHRDRHIDTDRHTHTKIDTHRDRHTVSVIKKLKYHTC